MGVNVMNILKKYKWTIITSLVIGAIYLFNQQKGIMAFNLSISNFKTVLTLLPPIFVIIGLMDVWVPRETMIKYMGDKSGLLGGVIAVFMGAIGAGPLYVAFPVAALLLKKGARLSYVFLFVSTWSSMKLPIIMYEWASLGGRFTIIHILSSLTVYVTGSLLMERLLCNKTKTEIYAKIEAA
jgi:uncharacterized membrane protein YraQ (UPF0718 family)